MINNAPSDASRLRQTAPEEKIVTRFKEQRPDINPETSSPDSAPTRFIGRQPILDSDGNIFGHELLFRAGPVNGFSGDAEHATRDVIDHYLLLMPQIGNEVSFVNCTRLSLMTGIVTLLPPASTVLEILENIEPDPELMQCCRELKTKGYKFALDDFSPDASKLPFLEIGDFIKIDFAASDAGVRKQIYQMARDAKATVLAEKVETLEDVLIAKAEGCKLFQGYFFSKPKVIATRLVPQNHATYLQLLSALTRTPVDLTETVSLVMKDASLCYRLLRLVNSPLYGLPAPVTSIRNAIMVVGDNEFRKMVTVALSGSFDKNGAKALIQMALERARFCELLAPLMNESSSRLYLLGMLSLIDVILSMPMARVVEALPVDADMKAALLGQKSPLLLALKLVRSHESGDWQGYADIQASLGITNEDASRIYVESVRWVDKIALFQ